MRQTVRLKYVLMNMDLAERISRESSAVRRKVGALLANENKIAAYGYNGTPRGFDNSCEDVLEDGTLVTNEYVIHAEENALLNIANSHDKAADYPMFVTTQPCQGCAIKIIQAGIKELYFRDPYRDNKGLLELLKGDVVVWRVHPTHIELITKENITNTQENV